MTPHRDVRLVRVVVALLCVGLFLASLAIYALHTEVKQNAVALRAMRQQNAELAREVAVERGAEAVQRQQIRALRRALRTCRESHGRQCTPPRPTPTPSPQVGVAPAPESPEPEPTTATASPTTRPSPTATPRASPSPSPTCSVRHVFKCLPGGG